MDRNSPEYQARGALVGHWIPDKFEVYAKLFHPFRIEIDKTDMLAHRKKEGGIITYEWVMQRRQAFKKLSLRHETWENLARKYGLVYHNELSPKSFRDYFNKHGWPENLWDPMEGRIEQNIFKNLINVLKESTKADEVCIFQDIPNSIMKDDLSSDLVLCSFNEVLEYFPDGFIGYLFATNHSWIIYTDTDLLFTLFGGPRPLMESLTSAGFEIIECSTQTRVADAIDDINKDIIATS